jgi:hypothetical protein
LRLRPARGSWSGLALLLSAGLLLAPLGARELPGEDFGRWEQALQRCRIQRTPTESAPSPAGSCRLLRLDQQMVGLLTVRFLQPGSQARFLERQLVFAGVLEEGSQGMACRQSRCEPHWPMRLRVSAVGQSGYGATRRAMELTRAQPASGQCLLEAADFRCEATSPEGEHWRAEASP